MRANENERTNKGVFVLFCFVLLLSQEVLYSIVIAVVVVVFVVYCVNFNYLLFAIYVCCVILYCIVFLSYHVSVWKLT